MGEVLCSAMDMPFDLSDDAARPFTEAGFRALARRGLNPAPSVAIFDPRSGQALGPSDWDLNPEFKGDLAVMPPPRPAAVLVPVMLRPALTVLFTQRSHALQHHAGQISFPGGRIEPGDRDAIDAALRETREEIGLAREFIEIIGVLPDHVVITGYRVTPVVGLVRPGFELTLDPVEVAGTFEAPLRHLLDPSTRSRRFRRFGQEEFETFELPWGSFNIWGATAGMLLTLREVLGGPSGHGD
jgi:8-oxo-dGTP pyrophosphatase MutT (NUDIX family)